MAEEEGDVCPARGESGVVWCGVEGVGGVGVPKAVVWDDLWEEGMSATSI